MRNLLSLAILFASILLQAQNAPQSDGILEQEISFNSYGNNWNDSHEDSSTFGISSDLVYNDLETTIRPSRLNSDGYPEAEYESAKRLNAVFAGEFTTIWDTTLPGTSGNDQITIPTNPAYTYNYTVDWGDGSIETNITGDVTHTFATPGRQTILISGDFPAIYFNDAGDKGKIVEILSWGTIQWESMEDAFHGCDNLNFDAIDNPDLTQVSSLKNMFRNASVFNGIINDWNVSSINDISGMFANAQTFNRPLDKWVTSAVTDMSETFAGARNFNEPLDNWNTALVTNMSSMFRYASAFNQNINSWTVTQVTDMSSMFAGTGSFNFPLNLWNVSNVENMSEMFASSGYNHPLENWAVGNVTNMSGMFSRARYNHPLEGWDVSKVTDMSEMFDNNRVFNHPLNGWDVSAVTDMSDMFAGFSSSLTVYNQPLDLWEVQNVTDMSGMFKSSSFNQPIEGWDVGHVENMASMFQEAVAFNQPLNAWNVENVENTASMFYGAIEFNQPLGLWDVGLVESMASMFSYAAKFNQSLAGWNVGNVTQMSRMFDRATAFDRNLGSWDIGKVSAMVDMLRESGLSETNYDNTLIGWSTQTVMPNVALGALGLNYCEGLEERQLLIDNSNWDITGDIINCDFVLCTTILSPSNGDTQVPANFNLVWEAAPSATGYRVSVRSVTGSVSTDIMNDQDVGNVTSIDFGTDFTPGDDVFVTVVPYNADGPAVGCTEESFTIIPTWNNSPDAFKLTFDTTLARFGPDNQVEIKRNTDFTYDYSIDWGDGQYDHNVSTEIVHSYQIPGTYTVAIIGEYPAHQYRFAAREAEKLISIDQWGTYTWKSMNQSFAECENMVYNATDIPDLSQVEDMTRMFYETLLFNGDINNWDVSNVTNMSAMFLEAESFNQPLDNWDVSKVTNMNSMFKRAEVFDQDISSWMVGEVTDMSEMFAGSFTHETIFNQPLNGWDVSKVTTMRSMFDYNEVFNKPLANWEVGAVTNMASMFDTAESFNQPIGNWDVSEVTDMSRMFGRAEKFNQPLAGWDVSKVSNMAYMFSGASEFNQPLNAWSVGNVESMAGMFSSASAFDQPLNSWDVSAVKSMQSMFRSASAFNSAISNWDTAQVVSMESMFERATAFNQPLRDWEVNSVVSMESMFEDAEVFDQPLDIWNVSAVANTASMFKDALVFDQAIGDWDVSSVTLMNSMFEGALSFNQSLINWEVGSVTRMDLLFKNATSFNESIADWDTGEVLTMREMFMGAAAYDQPMSNWNVSYVTTMESMFQNATAFNQVISSWNVASATTMRRMFSGAEMFNSPLDDWNVRRVTTMESMFENTRNFNQTINSWRVSGVDTMISMFENAIVYDQPMDRWDLGAVNMRSMFEDANSFDQYLGDWDISTVSNMNSMLDNTILTRENYDNTLIAWSEQTLTSGITLGAQGLLYCDALEERQSMIDTFGWSVTGDTLDCPVPLCTTLTAPVNGETDVPVNTNLTWEPALYARGYKLTVRVDPGGPLLTNELVTETFYEFPVDFTGNETVYVTLVPYNDTGDATGCAEESFTIINTTPPTVPECTNMTLPMDGDMDIPVDTDLEWTPISNADGYRITAGTSSGASDVISDVDVGNATSYNIPADLPENSPIFVTITPYNTEGDATGCIEERFTTAFIPIPPPCTNLTIPTNGEIDVPIDTDLSWRPIAEATGYLLTVGTSGGGIEVLNNVDVGNMTTYDLPEDLRENRLIFVTITPYNEVGDAISCAEETFRTGVDNSNIAPICTNLTTPSNGDTNIDIATGITWNAIGNADGYRITVSGSSSTANNVTDFDVVSDNFYDFTNDFDQGETVTVTIVPYNAIGEATGCTSESFTIMTVPLCTNLTAPADMDTGVAIDTNLEWAAIANADGYKLTVTGSVSTGNNIADHDISSGTTYDFPNDFEPGETVMVSITPYNAAGDAVACVSESFTIMTLPLCTNLTAPMDLETGVAIDTDLEWGAIADADGYKLTVTGSISTGNNIVDEDITTGNSYDFPNDFEAGETVTVTILPYNAAGRALGCATESFTIMTVPSCTNLTTPFDTEMGVAIDTNLEWAAIADADGYKLTIAASISTGNDIVDQDITSGNTYDFPDDFEPGETVTVTVTPYNAAGDAIGCAAESFTIMTVPLCTNLTAPFDTETGVAIDTDLEWGAIADADGYKLTVTGSISTNNNVTDLDISSGTIYDFPNDFEPGETVTVTITPYNTAGDAIGCTTESFTIMTVPLCANLTAPFDTETGVAIDTDLEWTAIADADGYKLTVTSSIGTGNAITDLDIPTGNSYDFTNDFEPSELVTVSITPYNAAGDALGCTTESFTIMSIPDCTRLTAPFNGAIDVAIDTDLEWTSVPNADGYRLSVGTNPYETDLVDNIDVASLTDYTFSENLPADTVIYVNIIPYNAAGDATGCFQDSFETEIIIPNCTDLTSPQNGATDVPLDSSINWDEAELADGYRISIGTTPSGNDIVNDLDVGPSLSYQPDAELPFETQIYVSITPYNSEGDAIQCAEQSFTTHIPEDETKYGFSPDGDGINEYWHIDNIEYYPENTVTIFNRWGDIVFEVQGYDNASNVFTGEANRMTKMGANTLPAGTYFFNIQVPENHILKKLQGFVVLKR
ncbi:BspA family leucine-rich repeat surface protein [Aggregatimonas sangjinii]|uniref:BspA family leucine-rich repeat surface protein n=1 Tax=Aggregatimonas sangjinii TaxID=2583587 RepID=A0A5B7SPV5_9FLAO|nr:BspA family leucine-rich repeat surface protein [Aggregatimonas sangjinii]QCW98663.1 BspA family leucine-rich repeat surface protein [Aggregatimonas sangjinii]